MTATYGKQVIILLMCLFLTTTTYASQDINAFFSQLLGLEYRLTILRHYTSLTDQKMKLFSETDYLILKNPSLSDESSLEDLNYSLSGTKISWLKEAAKGFVDVIISRGGRAGLVSFSDSAKIDSFLSQENHLLHAKIDSYRPQGRTCLHCGILRGIDVLAPVQEDDMVLLSDGHGSLGDLSLQAATSAASQGIKIHTVALGNNADQILLEDISQLTHGKFYKVRCKESLQDIYRKIALEVGSGVLVSDISDSMEEEFYLDCSEKKELCQARCMINRIISLLQPLYVTFIFLTAFYLIFLSASPHGRIRAKSALIWLILSMCIITLSPFILTLLFALSQSLTAAILSHAPENSQQIFSEAITYLLKIGAETISILEIPSLPFILSPYFILEAFYLMINVRYFLVLTFAVLFPFTIIFYPFPLTRRIGRLLLEQTLIWTFSQVALALVLVTVTLGINLIFNWSLIIPFGLRLIMELTGLFLLIITPWWMAINLRGFLP